ncbi:30 kDa heat shock protein, partial [Penicillium citrinum]
CSNPKIPSLHQVHYVSNRSPKTLPRVISPLLRFLDDYDNHRNTDYCVACSFDPNFDILESEAAFYLHGEGCAEREYHFEPNEPDSNQQAVETVESPRIVHTIIGLVSGLSVNSRASLLSRMGRSESCQGQPKKWRSFCYSPKTNTSEMEK